MKKLIKTLAKKATILLVTITVLSSTIQVTTPKENYEISLYSDELPTLDPIPNNG